MEIAAHCRSVSCVFSGNTQSQELNELDMFTSHLYLSPTINCSTLIIKEWYLTSLEINDKKETRQRSKKQTTRDMAETSGVVQHNQSILVNKKRSPGLLIVHITNHVKIVPASHLVFGGEYHIGGLFQKSIDQRLDHTSKRGNVNCVFAVEESYLTRIF